MTYFLSLCVSYAGPKIYNLKKNLYKRYQKTENDESRKLFNLSFQLIKTEYFKKFN